MGLDVGKVTIEYLERPEGLAYEFGYEMATTAQAWGEGNALGFYLRRDLLRQARAFARQSNATPEETAALVHWVRGLPWDGGGYTALTFNW
ncbi:MAG: hypothetical protein HY687_02410 [Chloroflexi bacterium]|nr:hypothetical protein [Chloroflexota bacterium]